MIVLKIIGLFLWLVIIPFCIGLLPVSLMPEKDRTPGTVFLAGYFVSFALFELIGIPVVILVVYHGFSWLSYLYMAAAILLALSGIFLLVQKRKKEMPLFSREVTDAFCLKRYKSKVFWKTGIEEKIGYLLFFLLFAFQIYMAVTGASFDGDDAYYGVQGVIAQQLDSLYRFDAYTGSSAPLDVRLALIPIWEAFIGRMSGIHATVIAHSVIPPVFLFLTYLLYFQIGKKLLADKKDMLPMFMILIALFQMFGNVSIYTNETFLLTRTWQGKSVAGNLVLPAVIWIFLCLFDKKEGKSKYGEMEKKESGISKKGAAGKAENGYYLLLACINLAAGVSSSLAVLLSALLVAGLALLFTIKERKFSILVKAGLCCIPSALYVLTYLVISH